MIVPTRTPDNWKTTRKTDLQIYIKPDGGKIKHLHGCRHQSMLAMHAYQLGHP